MSTQRYAIYFAPEPDSPLDVFGRQWLGRDTSGTVSDGQMAVPGLTIEQLARLTERPRRYGMHGTFKPPFALNASSTLNGLVTAARVLAKSLSPVVIPPLQLDMIGHCIALVPESSSAKLERLASTCVRTFEGFRQALREDQQEEEKRNKLTVHQEQMLEHWGYPYVMEEFRFHITLTEPLLDATERTAVMRALTHLVAPLLGESLPVREIAVFSQQTRALPMSLVARTPFGRAG